MKRLSRYALTMIVLLPAAGFVAGCGQEPLSKKTDVAESKREEPATAPAPGAGQTDEGASPSAPETSSGDPMDATGRGRGSDKSVATSDGEDSHAHKPPPKTSAPPPSPTTPAQPPSPPAAGGEPPPPPTVAEAQPEPAGGAAPPEAEAPAALAPADGSTKKRARTGAERSASPEAAGPDKVFDVVPVFYGTDRAVEADPERLKYGAERGHKLQLGRALVTVPTAHKVPAIERPWVIEIPYFKVKVYEETEDPAKHFTLSELKALAKEELLALVKDRLAKSSSFKDHAIVFVHGFNTSFDYALYRTAQIAYDLKFDGAPFVYSWPSGGKVASYTYDRGSAEQAEPHLAEFLDMVVKESGAKSISLIAHSMGNEVLLRVLERMRARKPEGVVISQVILAAPDVDRDKFDNIAREITGFAKGVTLYAASNDRALRYSASFWGGIPRAGDVPSGGPLIVPGVDTIDVSAVSTDSLGLNHSGYAENNALLNDIKLLIQTGERPPNKRIPILQAVTTEAGGAYWRYPPVK